MPILEDQIVQLDKITGQSGISKKVMKVFYPSICMDSYLGNIIVYGDVDQEDDFDYTDAVVGGTEVVAGGLIMILPVPGSKGVGTGLIIDGARRVLDNISEKSKENVRKNKED